MVDLKLNVKYGPNTYTALVLRGLKNTRQTTNH